MPNIFFPIQETLIPNYAGDEIGNTRVEFNKYSVFFESTQYLCRQCIYFEIGSPYLRLPGFLQNNSGLLQFSISFNLSHEFAVQSITRGGGGFSTILMFSGSVAYQCVSHQSIKTIMPGRMPKDVKGTKY